eukprot:evm.model.scf_702.2 EVM.evm.TU.scf_702.2   scf_702:12004-15294(-)
MKPGWLLKRYKRFLADVELEHPSAEGERELTVYCPNTGPMTGLLDQPSAKVLMSQSDNPKRKYNFTLEAIYLDAPVNVWVGIHSALANSLVKEMLEQRLLRDLEPYEHIKQEVKYGGSSSRADFLLTTATGREMYVEVKSVTLAEACSRDASTGETGNANSRVGLFPDTVSTRAQSHLRELMRAMSQGKEAACVFVIQRGDCHSFAPCYEKDPEFAKLLSQAHRAGVKLLAVRFAIIPESKREQEVQTTKGIMRRSRELELENERLRRDNERFVRLIDSGEWGRGRVQELSKAGEVLQSERDALMKLVQSLRKEHEAVEAAKNAQEEELASLKQRLIMGGSSTAAGRNKMLVRGASSFNGLVRAMKQELVDTKATKDPNLLYEVDRLSLDRVHVFPDGELKVEALSSVPGTAPFAQASTTPAHARSWKASDSLPQRIGPLKGSRMNERYGRQRQPSRGDVQAASEAALQVADALAALEPEDVESLERAVQESQRAQGTAKGPTSAVK